MDTQPYFHLVFQPNPKLVTTVRKFTHEFYGRLLPDGEVTSRLALATHEMLENAVTYANDGETAIRIELDSNVLTVRTWNRAAADRIEAIKSGIDRVMAAPDPEAYYQQQMTVAARRTDGSGLGLARVRNEAEMTLSYEIDDDKVCIRAVTTVDGVNS